MFIRDRGDAFTALHRLRRDEEMQRERIVADFEVFSQAAEAYPDGLVFLDADDRILWCLSLIHISEPTRPY